MKDMINVAEVCPSTEVLGPGKRFVISVQGCPFNCKNCIAPDWIPFKKANPTSIYDLAKTIIDNKDVSGITITGGEPFMQANRLARLLKLVKKERPELSVIVFSGFKKAKLNWLDAQQLLEETDVLIDGLYVSRKNDGRGLRGSNNQEVHFLTTALMPYQSQMVEQRREELEFHVRATDVLMVGIP